MTASSDVSAGRANTLPLAPAGTASGTAGILVFRVYLPAGGDFSAVQLPDLTLEQDGSSVTLHPCSDPQPSPAPASTNPPPPSTSDGFSRHEQSGAGFPNPDSGYLDATVAPPAAGQVVVISGKAPSGASGDHPSAWPSPTEDVRYWSMCNYLALPQRPLVVNQLPGGGTDYGCRPDEATKLNSEGYYTYVVGTEAQRAAIEQIPGVTFLPFSTSDPTTPSVLLLRNMLVSNASRRRSRTCRRTEIRLGERSHGSLLSSRGNLRPQHPPVKGTPGLSARFLDSPNHPRPAPGADRPAPGAGQCASAASVVA